MRTFTMRSFAVLTCAALAFTGAADGAAWASLEPAVPDSATSPTPSPSPVPPDPTPTPSPGQSAGDEEGEREERTGGGEVVEDADPSDRRIKARYLPPLTRAGIEPADVEETPVAPQIDGAPQSVDVDSSAELSQSVAKHELWTERPQESYDIVIAAGETRLVDAVSSALRSAPGLDMARARTDLLADEFDLAGEGDVVVTSTVAGRELRVPGAVFAVSVGTATSLDGDPVWLDLALDVSGVDSLSGAAAADRLQLWLMPACSLTTPTVPECVTGTPVQLERRADGVVVAAVPAAGLNIADASGLGRGASRGSSVRMTSGGSGGDVLVGIVGSSGQGGTFTATDLGSGGDWTVANQTGVFTYSVPLGAPPVDAGPVPDLNLTYSSAAVDGKNLATNGQAGLVGEGWSLSEAYIERRYRSCAADTALPEPDQVSHEGDQCWQSPVASEPQGMDLVLNLGGVTSPLVWLQGNLYFAEADPSIRVERLVRSGSALNGDNNSEYFIVRTSDGSRYFMGYGRAPDADPDTDVVSHTETHSVGTMPVFSDDPGEPSAGNFSVQGYRFMLDIEVDVLGNAAVYFYEKQSNRYAANGNPATSMDYTRAIAPTSIEYGLRLTDVDTVDANFPAQARVEYGYQGRCIAGTHYLNPLVGQPVDCPPIAQAPAQYLDVPADQLCGDVCGAGLNSPTFFHTQRLSQINTFVAVDGEWSPVETHQLIQAFPKTSQPQARAMWLDSVFTRGYLAGDVAQYKDTYAIRFYGTEYPNRVDWTAGGGDEQVSLDRRRISTIIDQLGARTDVEYYATYGDPSRHCPTAGAASSQYSDWNARTDKFDAKANTWDCYEVSHGAEKALYHRYLVQSVTTSDPVAGSAARATTYEYVGNPAWAFAKDRLYTDVEAKTNAGAGWTDYRGYEVIREITGAGETKSTTVNQFFRGLSKDFNGTGPGAQKYITPIGSEAFGTATPVEDIDKLRGYLAASTTLDDTGEVRTATRNSYEIEAIDADATGALKETKVVRPTVTTTIERDPTVTPVWTRRTSTETQYLHGTELPAQVTTTVSSGNETITTCTATEYALGIRGTNDAIVDYFSAAAWNGTTYVVAPSQVTSYWGTCGGSSPVTSKTDTYYDGATDAGDNHPRRGMPTTTVTLTSGSQEVTTISEFDELGRVTHTETVDGRAQTDWSYERDSAGVSSVTQSVTGEGKTLSATTWVEPTRGNVIREVDANGDYTHYRYDALGLLTAGWAPAQHGLEAAPGPTVVPTVSFEYELYATPGAVRLNPLTVRSAQFTGVDADGDTICIQIACQVRRSYTFYNGFGDVIEQHSVAPDGSGGRTVVATEYDEHGLAVRTSSPFWDALPAQFAHADANDVVSSALVRRDFATVPSYVETTYDWAGRPVTETATGAALDSNDTARETTYVYEGAVTKVTAPTGAVTETQADVLGRMIDQWVHPETGYNRALAQHTEYAYTVLASGGTRTTVTDHDDNDTVFETDRSGKRTKLTDPNAGETNYTYDPVTGALVEADSDAGTVAMDYDDFGRLISRTSTLPLTEAPSSSASWTYDPEGHIGQVASESATTRIGTDEFTVVKDFTYDAHHRLKSSTVTLPTAAALGDLSGFTYTEQVGYDEVGQPTTLTMPAVGGIPAETVTTGYNRFGSAVSLSAGAVDLVTGVTRDAQGRVTSRELGNGVTRSFTWDPFDGALSVASASYEDGASSKFFQHDVYVRDSVGRVTGVVDRVRRTPEDSYGVRDVAQCYDYDVHNRLERAWTVNAADVDAEDACVTAPTAQEQWLVDPTAFSASWEYELAGQVASSSQSWVGSGGVVSQVLEYVYDGDAPHAVTSTGVGEYAYDGAGRMIARDADGAGGVDGQELVWDAMSNLVGVTSTAGVERYVYDASGQRVVRVAGMVATAYVGSTELTDADTAQTGTLTGMRYYTLGSTTVALRDASGLSYLIGDVQGSASVLIPAGVTGDADPDTVVASRNAYTPYGVTRGDDNLVTDRGWLGQVEDASSGLTYLNARYYDPATARFISPDPLMDPTDPRTLDPYRYADNNPILYTDASGLSPACGGLTGDEATTCFKRYADAQKSGAAAKVKDTAVQKLNHNAAKTGSTKTFSKKDAPGATKKPTKPSSISKGGKSAKPSASSPPLPVAPGCVAFTGSPVNDAGTVSCYSSYGSQGQGAWSVAAREREAREGGPTFGEFTRQLTVEGVPYFWKHHGDEVLQVAGVVAFGVCVVASAGACAGAGAVLAVATVWDGHKYRDWDGKRTTAYVTFSLVTLGTGGAAAGAAQGPLARVMVSTFVSAPAAVGGAGISGGSP